MSDPLHDRDIRRAAEYMIALHGPHAAARAFGRAMDLTAMGQHGAATLWGQVWDAIRALREATEEIER